MLLLKGSKRTVTFVLAPTILLMGLVTFISGQQTRRITGTYTNMHFNKEGGDLLGEELRIVLARKGYQGSLQFAEGGAGDLILVNIRVDGNTVSFSIPESSGVAGEFNGTIQDGILRGLFSFKGGGQDRVELKKGKSYWD